MKTHELGHSFPAMENVAFDDFPVHSTVHFPDQEDEDEDREVKITALCCAALCCAVLCCAVLCCAVLCCVVLC